MTERLLQFIWQFQHFDHSQLTTSAGEPLQIIHAGSLNRDQGPDFSSARIRVRDTTWAGNIELHLKTSDWWKHGHHEDDNYNNVVLHVVWVDDSNSSALSIPLLELQGRVSKIMLERYSNLMSATGFIACEKNIGYVPHLIIRGWKDRLLAERLSRKAKNIQSYLEQSGGHWEESFWWSLARNFGGKVNAEVFEAMARSIPLKILAKHKMQIHQLEALLLGQARLLHQRFKDDYPVMLQKEYAFYRRKYALQAVNRPPFFLRMRPENFPTVRLAQLAMLVHESAHLFSRITEERSLGEVRKWFDITANDYWHYHYRFGEASDFRKKRLGDDMFNNIVINTIAPMLFSYGDWHSEEKYKRKALQWLETTSAENNSITRSFRQLNVENKSAFDSQALIELKNEYCDGKRCLECAIGNAILKG